MKELTFYTEIFCEDEDQFGTDNFKIMSLIASPLDYDYSAIRTMINL